MNLIIQGLKTNTLIVQGLLAGSLIPGSANLALNDAADIVAISANAASLAIPQPIQMILT